MEKEAQEKYHPTVTHEKDALWSFLSEFLCMRDDFLSFVGYPFTQL